MLHVRTHLIMGMELENEANAIYGIVECRWVGRDLIGWMGRPEGEWLGLCIGGRFTFGARPRFGTVVLGWRAAKNLGRLVAGWEDDRNGTRKTMKCAFMPLNTLLGQILSTRFGTSIGALA